MVDLLRRVKALVKVCFPLSVRPKHVPVVAISALQAIELQNKANQLRFTFQHFVEAEASLSGSLVVRAMCREVGLLVTDALDLLDQRLVNFNLPSVF